jgi:hypothetical protein
MTNGATVSFTMKASTWIAAGGQSCVGMIFPAWLAATFKSNALIHAKATGKGFAIVTAKKVSQRVRRVKVRRPTIGATRVKVNVLRKTFASTLKEITMELIEDRTYVNQSTTYLFAAALAMLVVFSVEGLAQSPDMIVTQARRASAPPGIDMVCDERSTISNFVNGVEKSKELQEAIVSTPRRGQGVIDLNSSFRQLLRVNGKPVSTDRIGQGSTPDMTTGGIWLGSTSGWVFSQRNSFEFKMVSPSKLSGGSEDLLVLQFDRREGSEIPWFVPDSGKFWLDPGSKRLVRMEIHDQNLTPMLNKEAARTIIEEFGSFIIDGKEGWLVKTRTLEYYPNRSVQTFTKTRSEFDKCRKFTVSSAIRPQR